MLFPPNVDLRFQGYPSPSNAQWFKMLPSGNANMVFPYGFIVDNVIIDKYSPYAFTNLRLKNISDMSIYNIEIYAQEHESGTKPSEDEDHLTNQAGTVEDTQSRTFFAHAYDMDSLKAIPSISRMITLNNNRMKSAARVYDKPSYNPEIYAQCGFSAKHSSPIYVGETSIPVNLSPYSDYSDPCPTAWPSINSTDWHVDGLSQDALKPVVSGGTITLHTHASSGGGVCVSGNQWYGVYSVCSGATQNTTGNRPRKIMYDFNHRDIADKFLLYSSESITDYSLSYSEDYINNCVLEAAYASSSAGWESSVSGSTWLPMASAGDTRSYVRYVPQSSFPGGRSCDVKYVFSSGGSVTVSGAYGRIPVSTYKTQIELENPIVCPSVSVASGSSVTSCYIYDKENSGPAYKIVGFNPSPNTQTIVYEYISPSPYYAVAAGDILQFKTLYERDFVDRIKEIKIILDFSDEESAYSSVSASDMVPSEWNHIEKDLSSYAGKQITKLSISITLPSYKIGNFECYFNFIQIVNRVDLYKNRLFRVSFDIDATDSNFTYRWNHPHQYDDNSFYMDTCGFVACGTSYTPISGSTTYNAYGIIPLPASTNGWEHQTYYTYFPGHQETSKVFVYAGMQPQITNNVQDTAVSGSAQIKNLRIEPVTALYYECMYTFYTDGMTMSTCKDYGLKAWAITAKSQYYDTRY